VERIAVSALASAAPFVATVSTRLFVIPLFLGGSRSASSASVRSGATGISSTDWPTTATPTASRQFAPTPRATPEWTADSAMPRASAAGSRPASAGGRRIADHADMLEELACELEDDELDLDPACAIACRRLLTSQKSAHCSTTRFPATTSVRGSFAFARASAVAAFDSDGASGAQHHTADDTRDVECRDDADG
jgi:hypothetical protein